MADKEKRTDKPTFFSRPTSATADFLSKTTPITEVPSPASPTVERPRHSSNAAERSSAARQTGERPSASRPIADKLVDVFILFNEREKAVASIDARLTKEGISTHFWDRDIPVGEAWEEVEQNMLQSAAVILLFLGGQGWGPTHLELARQAREAGKRIIPVLIGDPPAEAFDE